MDIKDTLQCHLAEVSNDLSKDSTFFAIMLYGSQNYGLDTPTSDIDSKLLIVPGVKDLVLGRKMYSKDKEMSDGGICAAKDYRLMFNSYCKGNINFVETLFTPWYIYNPLFKEEFLDLLAHRDLIANADPVRLIKMALGMAKNKYAMMEHAFPTKTELLEKYGYDPKQLHHLARLDFFAATYLEKVDFGACLHPTDSQKEYLNKLKTEPPSLEEARTSAEVHIEFLIRSYERAQERFADYPVKDKAREVKEFFEDLIVRIFNKALFAEKQNRKYAWA